MDAKTQPQMQQEQNPVLGPLWTKRQASASANKSVCVYLSVCLPLSFCWLSNPEMGGWVFKYFTVYCTDSRWSEANIMFPSKQIQVKRWWPTWKQLMYHPDFTSCRIRSCPKFLYGRELERRSMTWRICDLLAESEVATSINIPWCKMTVLPLSHCDAQVDLGYMAWCLPLYPPRACLCFIKYADQSSTVKFEIIFHVPRETHFIWTSSTEDDHLFVSVALS